jgi:ABC-2 type transport system ATP-binding protein
MGSGVILKIQQVTKSFGKRKIIKNINLDVEDGEILGLIGSSGSGKTTLLKTMIGFNHPEEGDVKFRSNSQDFHAKSSINNRHFLSVYSDSNIAKTTFGFASQEPSFYENLSVRENLLYFGSLYDLPEKTLHSNVDILMTLMDLKTAQNTLGKKLSGGMQRRLDIGCALIHDPEILILDEPTSDLDPALRNHIWSLVRKINKKGTTIILASHHLSEVEAFCSRIAIIKDGVLIDVDTPARLKAKYSESQEISIQTYPGDYHGIYEELKKKYLGVSGKVSSSGLIVKSNNPKEVLNHLLSVMESLDEELVDIRVSKPGLDELFLKITRSD